MKCFLKHAIFVAKQLRSGSQRGRKAQRKQFAPFDTIHAEALQRAVGIKIAQAVAVGKLHRAVDRKRPLPHSTHGTDGSTDGFGGPHRDHVRSTPVEKIIGEPAIE